jgi:hypothetical protein
MIFVVAGLLGSPATALTKQRPPVTETAVTQRQSDQDRLGAAAADTDQHEFGACQFANLLQIALGVHWQVAEGSGFAGGLFPSGRARPNAAAQVGGYSRRFPSRRYATQIFTRSSESRPSKFVTASSLIPLSGAAYRVATASNQPQRRARPAMTANSRPILCKRSDKTASSVGKGPSQLEWYMLSSPQ